MDRSFRRSHKAFTLIELLVVIAIIALLLSILVPTLNRAKELAKRLPCQSNLHGMGIGFQSYFNDNNDCIVPLYQYMDPFASHYEYWPEFIIKYFDSDARVIGPYLWGANAFSVSLQPANGDYFKDLAVFGPNTGPIYSRRMNCPTEQNLDDTHYKANWIRTPTHYFWRSWFGNDAAQTFFRDASGKLPTVPPNGIAIRSAQMKQLQQVCYVYDQQGSTTGAPTGLGGEWPMSSVGANNLAVMPGPHSGGINGMMLDGHVSYFSCDFVTDYISKDAGGLAPTYPFNVPDGDNQP